MDTYKVEIFRVLMSGPADVSGLVKLIDEGRLDPRHVVAILGKTEGNGGVNDFTREYASARFCQILAPHLGIAPHAVEARVALVMSGGTEGVLSPHATIFARVPVTGDTARPGKRLAVGMAATRDFLPEELGRNAQIQETAKAVRAAMQQAGIRDLADVHFVQIKCPLLTSERVEAAKARGQSVVTIDAYKSMAYSRAASALGIAMGLEEIKGPLDETVLCKDYGVYSSVASTSAGIELMHNAVVVLGNAEGVASDYVIGHSVMQDAIDLQGALKAFSSLGIDPLAAKGTERVVNLFAKAEPSPDGRVRGFRHTMLDDTDISPTRHARAAVGGMLAGVAGCSAIYVSGGAEHQGPAGGGPIAVIAKA